MKTGCISDSQGQMIVLMGFVISMVIIGMGTVVYSVATSGYHSTAQQSDSAYEHFITIRKEYGTVLMISSDAGNKTPFNTSEYLLINFESSMKDITASHGYILNFTWGSYYNDTQPTAEATITLFDGKNRFRDTVAYNLQTGEILYDQAPPGMITDLAASTGSYDGEIMLQWTAVGDDGYNDTAHRYTIRYSDSIIDSTVKFNNATPIPVNIHPEENGTLEVYNVTELEPGFWYFAIVVYDEMEQASPLSNSAGADAANWKPTVENTTSTDLDTGNSSINLTTQRGHTIKIEYIVTDKDHDVLEISLYLDNGSGWYSDDHAGQTWNDYNATRYEYTIPAISSIWNYYIAINDSLAGHNVVMPPGAPTSYFVINGTVSTITGNVTVASATNDTINLSAPYSGDFNNNNNVSIQYRLSSSSDPWDIPNFITDRDLFNLLIRIKDLNESTKYDFNVTYQDMEGVGGPGATTQFLYNVSTAP